jgi:hypothetical protein
MAQVERTAFEFATAANVEIVTVVAKGQQGRKPDEYALDVMRQLRVGNLTWAMVLSWLFLQVRARSAWRSGRKSRRVEG